MKKFYMITAIVLIPILSGCARNETPNPQTVTPTATAQSQENITETDTADNDIQKGKIPESAPPEAVESKAFFGKVKNIVGNEVELELGEIPELNDVDSEKFNKFYGTSGPNSMEKVELKERTQEDYIAPDPDDPIYGADGRINLTYTGETVTAIIHTGINIHNRVGGAATLQNIKKGSVLMIQAQIKDGQIETMEALTILE